MEKKILEWFGNGETGISSKAMALAVCGVKAKMHLAPSDPADFNRCLKLIKEVPEVKQHMDKVAAISETWAALVDRWDDVEQCFLDEVGIDWEKGWELRASKTYALMKEIGC